MDKTPCSICLEPYTKHNRAKVVCQYCPVGGCRPCQQNYLLSTYDDPHCYSCKQGWSSDFITSNFPMTFHTKTLRLHRRKILFEREKSMLPAMQIYVEAHKNIQATSALLAQALQVWEEKYAMMGRLRNDVYSHKMAAHALKKKSTDETLTAEEKEAIMKEYNKKIKWVVKAQTIVDIFITTEFKPSDKAYGELRSEHNRWEHVYETGDDTAVGKKKERREFLMRCPSDGCRGFLSTAYKCWTCDKKTCSDCLEVLGEQEHKCNPDAVETAKAIKRETQPCPKCGVRIYKIDGCDQMWCTVEGCGTAFSWNTGKIVTGKVHNPHYYEWLRRAGGGTAHREVGDIPCGGIPDYYTMAATIGRNESVSKETKSTLYEVHRNVVEFEDRLQEYPNQPPAMYNKDINVQFLMNKMTEKEWMTAMEHAEAKFNRKKEIGQILQTLVIAAADILRDIINQAPTMGDGLGSWLEAEALPALESLRSYTNDSFQRLSRSTRMAVPQIKDNWLWVPIRAIYRKSKNEIVSEEPIVEEAV
jgi:hypothetical protein